MIYQIKIGLPEVYPEWESFELKINHSNIYQALLFSLSKLYKVLWMSFSRIYSIIGNYLWCHATKMHSICNKVDNKHEFEHGLFVIDITISFW